MPNLTYMAVNGAYLAALAEPPAAGRVIAAFLPRFRAAVAVCIVVLLAASAVKFALWETLGPWLLARWGLLAAMTGLAAFDFQVLAPRLAAARAANDGDRFRRLHGVATATMSATLLLGLLALAVS